MHCIVTDFQNHKEYHICRPLVHLLSIIVVCVNNLSLLNTLSIHIIVYPVKPFIAINLHQVPPLVPLDEKDEFINTMFMFARHKMRDIECHLMVTPLVDENN